MHNAIARCRLGGGAKSSRKAAAKGLLSARERLDIFFDTDTFQEWGMHVKHSCHDFGMDKKEMPCDGVVTGVGRVNGRPIAAFSQDATVGGGALGQRHAKKICDIMDYALEGGMPLVAVNDSGGARIQEGVESLSGYGQVFYRNVLLSGCVPQIGVIAGNCAGGRGLFAGADGFPGDDARARQHVHLRSASDQGGDRCGLHDGRDRQRRRQRQHQWQCPLCRRRRSAGHADRGRLADVFAREQRREPAAAPRTRSASIRTNR